METPAASVGALRPLGVGEILDRAVNVCVRNFPTLAIIWLIFAVPLAVFQYLGTEDQTKMFGALAEVFQRQSSSGHAASADEITKALSSKPVFNVWTGLWIFSLLFVAPLPSAALALAFSAFYLGAKIDVGQAYRVALGRWLHLIGYHILWFFAAIVLYLIIVLGVVLLVVVLVLVTTALRNVGIVIDVVFGVLAVCAVLAFAFVVTLAYEVGFFSCVIERLNFATAFGTGIQRVFSRAGFGRSMLAGLAFFAIAIGIYFVIFIGQSILYGFLHSNVLGTAYSTLVSIATAAFTTAFVGIFYFDLRVRKEGLDLELALEAAAPAPPAPL